MIGALRLLNPQGIVGLAAAMALALLLILQKGETRHFRKESARFEQLYRSGEAARADLIAAYHAAAAKAREEDRANAARLAAAQGAINRSSLHDYQSRLANARLRADRLRSQAAADDRGSAGSAPVPSLPAAPRGPDARAGEIGLSDSERLIATEQAIQLQALIDWIRAQAALDPNRPED